MSSLEQQERHDWHTHATCSGDVRANFYPPFSSERKAQRVGRERRAKALCGLCPVREECLSFALNNDEKFGIWGGTTERERRLLVRPLDLNKAS